MYFCVFSKYKILYIFSARLFDSNTLELILIMSSYFYRFHILFLTSLTLAKCCRVYVIRPALPTRLHLRSFSVTFGSVLFNFSRCFYLKTAELYSLVGLVTNANNNCTASWWFCLFSIQIKFFLLMQNGTECEWIWIIYSMTVFSVFKGCNFYNFRIVSLFAHLN